MVRVGLCGRRWPASPAPGPLALALGLCLDYKSLSKEQNWSPRTRHFHGLHFHVEDREVA